MYKVDGIDEEKKKNTTFLIKFINLLRGEILHYKIKLSDKKIDEIIKIFQDQGNIFSDKNKEKEKEKGIIINKI